MNQYDLDEQMRRATEVQARYADMLMSKPNVVGVGIGYAEQGGQRTPTVALIVMVNTKLPQAQLDAESAIPPELDGVRVDVQQMGFFTAE